jgi:preprotein translocase subunit SecE
MTIVTGAAYSAMALLFAYGLNYLMSPSIPFLRSRSNLIAGMWLVVAVVQFFAYALYAWNFGFASERMVSPQVERG